MPTLLTLCKPFSLFILRLNIRLGGARSSRAGEFAWPGPTNRLLGPGSAWRAGRVSHKRPGTVASGAAGRGARHVPLEKKKEKTGIAVGSSHPLRYTCPLG